MPSADLNGHRFYTTDNGGGCANSFGGGGWWFSSCHEVHLTAAPNDYKWDTIGSLTASVMMIR